METKSANALLEEAFGDAAVWWYERADEICDKVIAESTDPKVVARAHWVKAVAIRNYAVDYRDDSLSRLYDPEVAAVKRLAPDHYLDTLARLDVLYAFYVSDKNDPAGALERYRKQYEATAQSDALSAYVLGQAYWQTAVTAKKGESESKVIEGYKKRAMELMTRACELRPNSYEFQSYRMTFLAETGQVDQAIEVGKALVKQFTPLGPYEFDRDPYCLYAASVGMKDPKEAHAILEARAKSPGAGASVFLELTREQVRSAVSDREKARILGEFIRRVDEGEIPSRGFNRFALASAHYKLAHELCVLNLPEQGLATYRQLAEISPNYAQIHYNKGVLLSILAKTQTDPNEKRNLLIQARKEYEAQLDHNWMGKSGSICRRGIDEVNELLQALSNPTPTPGSGKSAP